MEFNMSMVVPATPAELWSTLLDVPRISGYIPGCENVEEIERLATYKATVKQKIGPFKVKSWRKETKRFRSLTLLSLPFAQIRPSRRLLA